MLEVEPSTESEVSGRRMAPHPARPPPQKPRFLIEALYMSPVNPVGPSGDSAALRLDEIQARTAPGFAPSRAAPPTDSFGKVLDGLLGQVVAKDNAADAAARSILLGESDQLHQAMIVGAEADVAFVLMVEMRNKLLESYQELMRMQV